MIPIRLLNGSQLYVNADLVETIAATPDTLLTLTTGRTIVSRSTPQEVLDAVVAYRRRIHQPLAPTSREGEAPAEPPEPPGASAS